MLPVTPPPFYLSSVPLFSLSFRHALVTHICKIPFQGPKFSSWFYSFPLLSSYPNCLEELCPYSTPVYSSASSNWFSPHFSTKVIFIEVSSDLYAPKFHGHSSVFMLCDLSVNSNKIDPSFFLGENIFPWYPGSHILLVFVCLFSFLLCGYVSLSLCQIFLFSLTLKCWNCSGSALDPFLFSFYLSQLIHFHGLISMLRALKCVQLPRHFSNLKSHSNTCFASPLIHHKHICLELNSWSFSPCWRSCVFLSRSTLYPEN